MKKTRTLFIVVLILALLAVVFTGCATSSQDTTKSSTAASPSAVVPASSAAQSSTVPSDVTASSSAASSSSEQPLPLVLQPITSVASDQIKTNGSEPKPTTKKDIKVGLVPPVSVLYHETVKKGCEEAIASLPDGYKMQLLYQMPTSTSEAATTEQINIMEQWINQKVDAMIMCPVADDAPYEAIFKEAEEAGVPVFEYGADVTMLKNAYVTCANVYSQYDSAKAVGAWVAENMKDKALKIAVVAGPKGPPATLRDNGFRDGLKSHPNFEIVAEQSGDWMREKAVNVTENMLTANPDINMVFCMYDEMAMGAASAIKNRGLADKVTVIGYDMNIESLQAIKDGIITCSVYNGTKEAGQDCIKLIKKLVMDGEQISKLYLYAPKVINTANAKDFDTNLLKID